MKENITIFLARLKNRGTKQLALIAAAVLVPLVLVLPVFFAEGGTQDARALSGSDTPAVFPVVATVGEENSLIVGSGSNNSWPAEIVTSDISQVQPKRMGTITEWRVRIGDRVTAGQVLGRISAPPATPELIKMLAEQTEATAKARAQVDVVKEYNNKEQERLAALKSSLESAGSGDPLFGALLKLREKKDTNLASTLSFLERKVSAHTKMVSNAADWRYFKQGSLDRSFGSYNQALQNDYEQALLKLVASLKSPNASTLEAGRAYFTVAVRFSNSSASEDAMNEFKTMVAEDQNEFLEMLAEYRDAEVELADKETEYKIMISERNAMLEKDVAMAYAEAAAAESAYKTVAQEIVGSAPIVAPRSGIVSAIYRNVGDLVDPEMSIALIANRQNDGLIVRMRIPNNVRKPLSGDIVSVIRPGFPNDARKARIVGVGASLDQGGSYMADAVLVDPTDWPTGSSVRVLVPFDSESPVVKMSSILWDEEGVPSIWAVSAADRIYKKKLRIGRTLGDFVEVYEGVAKGDRYIANPDSEIAEDMFLRDIIKQAEPASPSAPRPSGHEGHENMEGM